MQEVTGSTPVFSTKRRLSGCRFFCCLHNRTGDRQALLIKGGFGRIVYMENVRIAHRFDPGILHKKGHDLLVSFFVWRISTDIPS